MSDHSARCCGGHRPSAGYGAVSLGGIWRASRAWSFSRKYEFVKPIVVDNDDEFTNSCSRHFRNRVSYLRSNYESKDADTEFAFTKFEDACEKVRECKKVHAEALVDFNSRVHARLSTEEVQALLAPLSMP
jgi:hypothetical protein